MSDYKAYIEDLKAAVSLEKVVGETGGLTVRRQGKYFTTREHDSLSIDAERGWFEWYSKGDGPGSKGDVIEWLMHWGGCGDFEGAIRWLADRTGLQFKGSEEAAQKYQAKQVKYDTLTVIAQFLGKAFWATASAKEYAEGRGFSEETLQRARVGYWHWDLAGELRAELQLRQIPADRPEVVAVLGFSGDVAGWADKYGLDPKEVKKEWIEKARVPGMPKDLLIYPHFERGKCVYLSGRRLDYTPESDFPKAWNMRALFAAWQPFFNAAYTGRDDYLVVVEGQADAITLAQWGIPSMALVGAKSKNEMLIERLRRIPKVYVALDADQAGAKGTRALAELLGPATLVVTWPGGGDANDWLKSGGGSEAGCRELLIGSPIYALWMARRWRTYPPMEQEDARRYAYELMASLLPYDYAMNAGLLAEVMGLRPPDLNRVVRAIKTERDLAAQGVEEAQPVLKDAPKTVKPSKNGHGPQLDEALEDYLVGESRDHEGHAQCCKRLFGDKIAFVPEWGWMTYNGKHWVRDGADHQVQHWVVETLKLRRHLAVERELEPLVTATACKRNNVLSTQGQLERMVLASVNDFDSDPDLLNVGNGVLDLRTGAVVPHSPQQRFTYCLAADYNPKADYSDWLMFLVSATGPRTLLGGYDSDPELLNWLQQAVGYSLTGRTSEAALFYLYGPTRSGKGTFTQTLLALLDRPLGAAIDFNVLTQQRSEDSQNFALAPLKPCRLLVGNEPGKYERFNEAKMKQLTGEDMVRCSLKHRDAFEYKPQYKIWLSSNWPFNADTSDEAAWGRARVVVFPNSFLGKEDKGLKDRLQSIEGLEGVLAWAVEGAIQWFGNEKGLKTPQSVQEATKIQRHEQDFIQQFLDDCTEEADNNEFVISSELYAAYVGWSASNLVTAQKQRSFSLALQGKGIKRGKAYVSEGPEMMGLFEKSQIMPVRSKQVRVNFGLKLNEDGKALTNVKASARHKTEQDG